MTYTGRSMKTFIAVLTFLVFSVTAFAQDKDQSKYYYIGSIGDGLSIQMELSLEGSDVQGSYYYNKYGTPIDLSGQINSKDSTITLTEKADKGESGGKFAGSFTPIGGGLGTTMEGTFSKSAKLPFKLTKVANYEFSVIKQGNFSEAKWSYPKLISKNEVIQKISNKLYDRMKPQIEEYQKDAKEGFMEDLITSTWIFNYDYSIEYYSDELFSFTGLVYSYTGGAHGNTYFVSSNYSINEKDSKLLELSDLFKKDSNYVKVLSDFIIKDLKKQKAGWVVNGEIKSLKEDEIGPFALSPRGIQFAFAPYAVGPYSDGAFFVTISYYKLKNIIKTDGPLAHFIKSRETKIEQ